MARQPSPLLRQRQSVSVIAISHAHRKHRDGRADGGMFAVTAERSILTLAPGLAVLARLDTATDSEMPGRIAHMERIALRVLHVQGFLTANERPVTQTSAGMRVTGQTGAS